MRDFDWAKALVLISVISAGCTDITEIQNLPGQDSDPMIFFGDLAPDVDSTGNSDGDSDASAPPWDVEAVGADAELPPFGDDAPDGALDPDGPDENDSEDGGGVGPDSDIEDGGGSVLCASPGNVGCPCDPDASTCVDVLGCTPDGADAFLCAPPCQFGCPWDWACNTDGFCAPEDTETPPDIETCNGVDDDDDGLTDEPGAYGCTPWYIDSDSDGWGRDDDAICACGATAVYTANKGGDCNDGTGLASPAGVEICDGLDNDCDGTTDGLTQSCGGGCGAAGISQCTGGSWGACSGGGGTVCSPSDPCCASDGCGFKSASTVCSATPLATKTQCSGGCGGTVTATAQWPRCNGASAFCGSDNPIWISEGAISICAASKLCQSSGATAECVACPYGCASHACTPEPEPTEIPIVVCIDPGYGGTEPGPAASGTTGNAVIWALAQDIKAWLDADTANTSVGAAWTVVFTRTAAEGPTETARAQTCNMAGATRVLALRVNGCCGGDGTETWIATGAGAATTAFANWVQDETLLHGGLDDRGVKLGTFTLLKKTTASAAMVFPAFLDNPSEGWKMSDSEWRDGVARGLVHSLQGSLGKPTWPPE